MKRNLQYTPSTAHKKSLNFQSSSKIEYSPNLLTPSNRRKGSNFGSKISSLRQTIDDLISSISDKQSLQKSGVQRVWEVNTELCENLSHEQQYPRALSVHSLRQDPAKDLCKTSTFGEASTHFDNKRSQYDLHQSDNQQQSLRIKQAINNQMRSTNELMGRLKSLQNEHEYLRDQQQVRQNSVSQYEIDENRRLKQQLNRLNNQSAPSYTVEDLWRQFCELKEQNQRLRQQTIGLLKRDQSQKRFYDQNNLNSTCAY